MAFLTLVIVTFLNHYTEGLLKLTSILLGMAGGYVIGCFMGMVDFGAVSRAGIFQTPSLFHFGVEFEPSSCVAIGLLFAINAIQAIGDFTATTTGSMGREPTDQELKGAIVGYGCSNVLGAALGGLPTSSYSPNVGIVTTTKVINRVVLGMAAGILLVAGLVPKFSALLTTVSQCVLGGATISVFASIAMTGIKLITAQELHFRNMSVVGLAVAIGVGVTQASAPLAQFPAWVTTIFGKSPVVVSTIAAVFLNLALPKYVAHVQKGKCTGGVKQAAPCVSFCPAGVDIPGYVALVREGRLEDAVRLIRKDNPLATVCAFICEHPCEARHRRNMLDQSVNIRGLKRYATDHAGDAPISAPAQPTGKKVAIIGGGPGGISAAYYLSRMGHQVTIYEQRKRLGGMLRYGIPAYRLPREVLDKEIETLLSDGVEVKLGVRIGKEITIVKRMKNPEKSKLPLFTSCCPGWVRFLKSQYPKMTGHLSTAKSPQQMFGAVAKSYYSQLLGADSKKIFCLSVMPCLAKKRECALPTMNDAGAGPDVDASLTVREIDRMIRAERIDVSSRSEEAFDQPLGVGAGAAVIFGATGGVMEAALRSAYYLVTGENPRPDSFQKVRGLDGWKEAVLETTGN